MLALRQIYTNEKQQLAIKLPPEFDTYEKNEVIILPLEPDNSNSLSTKEVIKRFDGSIPDFLSSIKKTIIYESTYRA